jgi:AcrR family transcriptional regulator
MRPHRPRSAEKTRAAILAAARSLFGANGFEQTTVRAVAREAGVDPALVIRYFGNKAGLFAAAAQFELGLPSLEGVPPEQFAELLIPHFFATWEHDPALLPMLRASATSPVAAAAMARVFAEQVMPALAGAARDAPAERVALVGAQVLGLAFTRYILHAPPIVEMTPDQLRRWLAPVFAYYLTAPYPADATAVTTLTTGDDHVDPARPTLAPHP